MTNQRAKQAIDQLSDALDRFTEILAIPADENTYVIDAAIHRFEFVIELYWKAFKQVLATQGKIITLPKQALQEAYQANWIEDETIWLKMLQDRNSTSHTYKEKNALEIYQHLKDYLPMMKKTLVILKKLVLKA